MARLHTWQTSLSASHRRDAAYHARASAYWQAAPKQARLQRLGADILAARHMAQDHAVGRKLDAIFEHVTAPRPLMAPPSTTPWTDRTKLAACLIGIALRQAVDLLASLVGIAVGLARLPLSLSQCNTLVSKADLNHVQQGVTDALREQVRAYLAVKGDQVTDQFRTDHHRLQLTIGDAPCKGDGRIEGKMALLRALCDGDSTWARGASVLMTQFAANCYLDRLWSEGKMHLGSLPVQSWFQRSKVQIHATRDGDAIVIRMTCDQTLSHLLLGRFSHPEVMQPCEGDVSFGLTLRVPRPGSNQTATDVALGFEASKFAFESLVRPPSADRED